MISRKTDNIIMSFCTGFVVGFIIGAFLVLIGLQPVYAEEIYASPDQSEYFNTLMMPDDPKRSCCGEADVYWADKTDFCRPEDEKAYSAYGNDPPDEYKCALIAIITDTRPDVYILPDGSKKYREHIPVGTRMVVKKNNIRKHPSANPTDHNILFAKPSNVICWEPLSGG